MVGGIFGVFVLGKQAFVFVKVVVVSGKKWLGVGDGAAAGFAVAVVFVHLAGLEGSQHIVAGGVVEFEFDLEVVAMAVLAGFVPEHRIVLVDYKPDMRRITVTAAFAPSSVVYLQLLRCVLLSL